MTKPYILKMSPYLRPKIWGGRKLDEVFGKDLPEAGPYGESWEVSDLEEGQSVVCNGPLAGSSLSEVVSQWGAAMTGANRDGQQFPLLVKILDASDDLSVQVHPSDADIARLGLDADSKDETWIILDSDADPNIASDEGQTAGCILHGFEKATTPADFRMAVDENRAAESLRREAVFAGDVIRVAPGTIHAICAGVALLEIQEPSDTTYRVYDYQRPGMDGKPRELHLEKAMQVSNFDTHAPAKLSAKPSTAHPAMSVLVDVPAYRIEKASGVTELEWTVDARTPQVVFVTSAHGVELSSGDETVTLGFAQTAVIPAGVGAVQVRADKPADIIISGLGGDRKSVV